MARTMGSTSRSSWCGSPLVTIAMEGPEVSIASTYWGGAPRTENSSTALNTRAARAPIQVNMRMPPAIEVFPIDASPATIVSRRPPRGSAPRA